MTTNASASVMSVAVPAATTRSRGVDPKSTLLKKRAPKIVPSSETEPAPSSRPLDMDSEQQKQLVARWTHAESSFDAGHHPKLGDFGANLVAECIKEKLQPRIKSIRLTSHQIGDAGCVTLASAIADSGIISLDLSGNSIGEHGWAALGNTLQRDTTLRHLAVGENSGSSPVGHGLQVFTDGIKANSSLRSLVLRNCQLSDEAGSLICSALASRSDPSLDCLDLSHNATLGALTANALARIFTSSALSSQPLKSLTLRACRGLGKHFGVIGAALQQLPPNHKIAVDLNLRDCALGPLGGQCVADTITATPHALHSLDLSCNSIGDAAGVKLAQALAAANSKCKLTALQLCGNQLDDASALAFAELIGGSLCASLTELELSSKHVAKNEYGDEGSIALAHALQKNTTLLSFRTEYHAGMDYIESPAGAAFAEALRINCTLQTYDGPGGVRVVGETTIDVAQRNDEAKAAAREAVETRLSEDICILM